jgi:hypothetical protein
LRHETKNLIDITCEFEISRLFYNFEISPFNKFVTVTLHRNYLTLNTGDGAMSTFHATSAESSVDAGALILARRKARRKAQNVSIKKTLRRTTKHPWLRSGLIKGTKKEFDRNFIGISWEFHVFLIVGIRNSCEIIIPKSIL